MKLTQHTIEKARYAHELTGGDYRWDDDLLGFGLRIYPSGRKAFVVSYRARSASGSIPSDE